jgi:anti-sigma factor RsiW
MSCERIEEQMPDYIDGDLPEAQRLEFALHLEGCCPCRLELEKFEKTWAMLDLWEPVQPSALMRAHVWEKIRTQPVRATGFKGWLGGLRLGILSSIATACLVLTLSWAAAVPVDRDSDLQPASIHATHSAEDMASDLPLGQVELFEDSDEQEEDPINVGQLSHHLLDQTHDALQIALEDHD